MLNNGDVDVILNWVNSRLMRSATHPYIYIYIYIFAGKTLYMFTWQHMLETDNSGKYTYLLFLKYKPY